jgi:Zn-dependent protease/CBS domain-containing protein
MKWSLSLGRIAGIKVFIHWTFLILIGWIVIQSARQGQTSTQILWTLAFLTAIFVCVFLHEMGHSLTAQKYKINTRDITLLPIGGLARFENLPEDPKQELLVALAGPAVNLVIAGLIFLGLNTTGLIDPEVIELTEVNGNNFLYLLLSANLVLAVFNLVPAFPMDGGRAFRALLSFKFSRVKATRIAAGLGQILAIAFVFVGLFYNPILLLIGIFIFLGAQAESSFAQTRDLLRGYQVADVTMEEYKTLHTDEPLSHAIDSLLDGQSTRFLVEEQGDVVGTLNKREMVKALSERGRNVSIGEVMNRDLMYLEAQTDLKDAFMKMQRHKHDLILVTQNDQLRGVLDLENIQEFIMLRGARPDEQTTVLKEESQKQQPA